MSTVSKLIYDPIKKVPGMKIAELKIAGIRQLQQPSRGIVRI